MQGLPGDGLALWDGCGVGCRDVREVGRDGYGTVVQSVDMNDRENVLGCYNTSYVRVSVLQTATRALAL